MRTAKVIFYQDKRREWRWQLKSSNSRILADSAEGYTTRVKAMHGYRRVGVALLSATWHQRHPTGLVTRL